ncbi:MAG: hypothetical protein HY438_02395 [DPANN group archaeon]|nr:hypothetical protein [DPANN group archaeon]
MPITQLLEDYLREVSQSIPIYVHKNETILLLRHPEIIAISEDGQDLTNSIFFTRSAGNSQGSGISFNGQHFSLVNFPDNDILKKFNRPLGAEIERYSNPTVVNEKFILEQYFFNEKTEPQYALTSSPIWFITQPTIQPHNLIGRDCTLSSAFKYAIVIHLPRQDWRSWPGGPGILFEAGEKAFSENKFERAIGNYIRCASVLPNSQILWDKLRETFKYLQGNSQKTRAIENIAGIAPHKSDVWLRKGRLAEEFLFNRTAVKFYENALKIGERNNDDAAITSLSNLLLKIGRPRKLIRNPASVQPAYTPPPGPPPPLEPKAEEELPPELGVAEEDSLKEEKDLLNKLIEEEKEAEQSALAIIAAKEIKIKQKEILARLSAERILKSKSPATPSARIMLDLVDPSLVDIVTFYEQGGKIFKAMSVGDISGSTMPTYGRNGLAIVRRDGRLNYYLRSKETSPDGKPVVDFLTDHFAPIGTFALTSLTSGENEMEHALNHAENKKPHDKTVCLACTYKAKKKPIQDAPAEKSPDLYVNPNVLRAAQNLGIDTTDKSEAEVKKEILDHLSAAGKPKPTAKVRCKCGNITPIFGEGRPVRFECPNCSRKGVVR